MDHQRVPADIRIVPAYRKYFYRPCYRAAVLPLLVQSGRISDVYNPSMYPSPPPSHPSYRS